MNALSQIGKQFSELVNSLTPAARLMAGLMVGVIVVSLGWIISTETTGNYESLLGGISLTNAELDRIETAFGDAQLRDYQREGRQIRIPRGEKDQYLKALSAGNALPKEWGSEKDRAFAEGNVFESAEKFSARMQTADERELANTLTRMPGIERASVRYDQQRKGFGRETERVCSIELQGPQNQPIPEATLRSIAEHVSKHFAGLPKSNISVLDLGTSNVYSESDDPRSASENPVLKARKDWERYLDAKVGSILHEYGAIELFVSVEIDPTLVSEEEKLSYDPTAVTVQSNESRKDSENSKPTTGGPPGSDTNGIGNKPQSVASAHSGHTSTTKESEATERRVAGHGASRKETAGLIPTSVTATIGIPESYYYKVFAHRASLAKQLDPKAAEGDKETPPALPTAAQLAELKAETETNIRAAVEGMAMGIRDGDDRKPYVTVYAFPDLPPPEFPTPSLAAGAATWLGQSWSTLALMALVLLSLGMMFSWIKSQATTDSDRQFSEGFGLEVPDMGDELELSEGVGGEPGETKRPRAEFEVSGSEMKEDLSTLIKDNPDAVVNLLKSWIGDAA
ncbi:MAG: hypothetical protein IT422_12820 [Pirellulaceae bacterium]|nr:hypothetical protein [Pirellulaceae bacterium]